MDAANLSTVLGLFGWKRSKVRISQRTWAKARRKPQRVNSLASVSAWFAKQQKAAQGCWRLRRDRLRQSEKINCKGDG